MRSSVEQIVAVLSKSSWEPPVAELIRQAITEQTLPLEVAPLTGQG